MLLSGAHIISQRVPLALDINGLSNLGSSLSSIRAPESDIVPSLQSRGEKDKFADEITN